MSKQDQDRKRKNDSSDEPEENFRVEDEDEDLDQEKKYWRDYFDEEDDDPRYQRKIKKKGKFRDND